MRIELVAEVGKRSSGGLRSLWSVAHNIQGLEVEDDLKWPFPVHDPHLSSSGFRAFV